MSFVIFIKYNILGVFKGITGISFGMKIDKMFRKIPVTKVLKPGETNHAPFHSSSIERWWRGYSEIYFTINW